MEHHMAGEGNSSSTSQRPFGALSPRTDRDDRRAYGRLVARELASLREREPEPHEQHALQMRVRRWWSSPQLSANLPIASRA